VSGVHSYGPLDISLDPIIARVQGIPGSEWTYRGDLESKDTRVVRESSTNFPKDEAEELFAQVSRQYLGPGYMNRAVLSCVPAGKGILPHVDDFGEEVRQASIHCHLPLITDPAAVMEFPGLGETHHLEAGCLYAMDERETHCVRNPASIDRIHLLFAFFPDRGAGSRRQPC